MVVGKSVLIVNSTQFLGAQINSELTWSKQINSTVRKTG